VTAANGHVRLAARSVGYRLGGRTLLAEATVAASAGELLAVIGPNGAGKSTLLRALAGLVEPTSGTVDCDGESLRTITPQRRSELIAYLAQERTVHWPMTARAIVALGRLPHLPPGRRLAPRDHTAVDAALTAMDVTHLAQRPILELSGGERARVLLARSLAQQPQILIADEPTAGIDPAHQITLLRHLRTQAMGGMAVLVALHDLALASQFADLIVLMAAGRTIATGTPGEILTDDVAGAAYGIRLATLEFNGVRITLPGDIRSSTRP
jgi:iron complex transport system ATP-binding protein